MQTNPISLLIRLLLCFGERKDDGTLLVSSFTTAHLPLPPPFEKMITFFLWKSINTAKNN
ncbi:MAG: hypothetical protein D6732_27150 [Methanobacteriota archaeon]|nr:MAG: hypothetical protein D6732_27150 [Euryarchaeota archaeon]